MESGDSGTGHPDEMGAKRKSRRRIPYPGKLVCTRRSSIRTFVFAFAVDPHPCLPLNVYELELVAMQTDVRSPAFSAWTETEGAAVKRTYVSGKKRSWNMYCLCIDAVFGLMVDRSDNKRAFSRLYWVQKLLYAFHCLSPYTPSPFSFPSSKAAALSERPLIPRPFSKPATNCPSIPSLSHRRRSCFNHFWELEGRT